ncbi:divergent protein kinase domain 1A-like isoform X2 [Lineus longissimus]|uniref:divergent protein kinase domain 1A-like isoform X2 n=1 Tax=Lineus longissimus TaxID=88925 RepID=UPI00315DB308
MKTLPIRTSAFLCGQIIRMFLRKIPQALKFFSHLKCRHFIILGLAVIGAMVLTIIAIEHYYDNCQIHSFKRHMCSLYDRNIITGPLCPKLCKTGEIQIKTCETDKDKSKMVYFTDRYALRLGKWSGEFQVERYASPSRFETPKQGTSMEEFRSLLGDFLLAQFGKMDQSKIYRKIIQLADVNNDGKLSLSEAKTIWSLLQNNEFFLLIILSDSAHVPKVNGFCGDMYAIEKIPNTYLYLRSKSGLMSVLRSDLWGLPDWKKRAKIAVGLLEFALEVYQHGPDGSFYMCDTQPENIGYTKQFDVRIQDLSLLLSNATLHKLLRGHFCSKDEECIYTEQCKTTCNLGIHRCTGDLIRPSLSVVCEILNDYILSDTPSGIQGEVQRLLERCTALNVYSKNMHMEHSLILNDLKSLLWKQISS